MMGESGLLADWGHTSKHSGHATGAMITVMKWRLLQRHWFRAVLLYHMIKLMPTSFWSNDHCNEMEATVQTLIQGSSVISCNKTNVNFILRWWLLIKLMQTCNWRNDHCNEMEATVETLIQGSSITGLILGLHPANERRRYFVTTSLIGWAQA